MTTQDDAQEQQASDDAETAPEVADTKGQTQVIDRALAQVEEARTARTRLVDDAFDGSDEQEEEAVHDLRVAVRRLRSSLKSLLLTHRKKRVRPLIEGLGRAAARTGDLRDEEVLRATLTDLEVPPNVRATLDHWMKGRARREQGLRGRVVRDLAREVADEGLSATLDEVHEGLTHAPKRPLDDPAFARAALLMTRDRVRERAKAPIHDSDGMHRLRIGIKQLRYTLELTGDLVVDATHPDAERRVKAAERAQKRAAKLQKLLGTLHDLDEATSRMGRAWGLDFASRSAVLAAIARKRHELAIVCEREIPLELAEIEKSLATLLAT